MRILRVAMKFEERSLELPDALVTRTRQDLVEVRITPASTITVEGLHAIHAARTELCANAPHVMLFVVPYSVGFEMSAMQHEYVEHGKDPLVALAVVAGASVTEMMTKLYFSYFPQLFRTMATNNEAEARAWLDAQLAELSRTG